MTCVLCTYRLVVVVGDLNCCYGRIDSAYEEEEEEAESVSGIVDHLYALLIWRSLVKVNLQGTG